MKRVNLLPRWYIEREAQRRSMRIRLGLMLCLGAVMFGWTLDRQVHLAQLRARRDDLTKQAQALRDVSGDLARQEGRAARLKHLQQAVDELGNTVPMSAVIQQIMNNMTAGMAMSRITIDVRPEPLPGSAPVGAGQEPPRYRDVAHITVVGIAPTDVQIAQLIGKLSENPLFSDLSLNYTRTESLRDYAVRRFELLMHIDLDRLVNEEPQPHLQARASEDAHGS